jgi:CcmD family protein
MNKTRLVSLLCFVLFSLPMMAQDKEAEMADVFRAEGKIYTVVAVLAIVLTGLFVYLFLTERRLANLEKQVKK